MRYTTLLIGACAGVVTFMMGGDVLMSGAVFIVVTAASHIYVDRFTIDKNIKSFFKKTQRSEIVNDFVEKCLGNDIVNDLGNEKVKSLKDDLNNALKTIPKKIDSGEMPHKAKGNHYVPYLFNAMNSSLTTKTKSVIATAVCAEVMPKHHEGISMAILDSLDRRFSLFHN